MTIWLRVGKRNQRQKRRQRHEDDLRVVKQSQRRRLRTRRERAKSPWPRQTPKRKAPQGDVEHGSRSKTSKKVAPQEQAETKGKKALKKATEAVQEQVKTKGKKAKVTKAEVSKAKKKRASKGEAVSFARRNAPRNKRGNAEWHAIRDAYRQSLSHLHPQTENED